jgi:putative Mg2+ transporter-C (MgtC) family protein
MKSHYIEIAINLAAALAAGTLIGFERDYHGRPAGLRTHALVCLASALLMTITAFQIDWLVGIPPDAVRTDPTRMAQGIMTGIGFLGAGVIFMEGINVRGLTTAASIWITAALGILYGIGFFYPAVVGTAAVLAILTALRQIEARMPSQYFAQHLVRFAKDKTLPEAELRKLVTGLGFSIANMNYRLEDEGREFEYRMTIQTTDRANLGRLAEALRKRKDVLGFRISPSGD